MRAHHVREQRGRQDLDVDRPRIYPVDEFAVPLDHRIEVLARQPAAHTGGWNYGWPIMEGNHCYPADRACDRTGLTLPLLEYDHTQGCSVTDGYVYRGQAFPGFQGVYVFGDFCTGRIWGVVRRPGSEPQVVELAQVDLLLSSFGEDEQGEIYVLHIEGGELFKLVVAPR